MKLMRAVISVSLLIYSCVNHASDTSVEPAWYFNDDITIPTLLNPEDPLSETIYLPANIYIPESSDPNATFPAIIFISSWALDEYEYGPQARELAARGYVVLSYTTRGFRGSPGEIMTAGIEDQQDASAAIDYLLDNQNKIPVNPDAIGLSGISYGAGISMIVAMRDERVKAVVAMSGWGSLIESLWAGNTPNFAWLELLIASGKPIPYVIRNRMSPEIRANYNNLKLHQNVPETKAWALERSSLTFIDEGNARANPPAVFISNNLHDYLFQPNSVIEFCSRYKGPWRLDFNRGTHASGEAGGLLGTVDHHVWQNLASWFDYYLKGIDNGIAERKPLNTKVLNTNVRESYGSISPEDEILHFNLIPDAGSAFNTLSAETSNDVAMQWNINTLNFIGTGGGVPGQLQHTGRTLDTNTIDLNAGMVFTTSVLESTLRLRGASTLNLTVIAQDKAQYFAYLYFLNPDTGIANWVGHAPFTCHQSEGCALTPGIIEEINLEFYWTAVDIPAGTQLMLVVDGYDPDYWRYALTPESETVIFNPQQPMVLDMPIVWQDSEYDNPQQSASEMDDSVEQSRSANGSGTGFASTGAGGSLGLLSLLVLLSLSGFRRSSRR